MTRTLVDTAMGKLKADLVVKNASLVNVNSAEIIEGQDVAIKKDRIAFVGNAEHTIGLTTRVLNANGRYLVPGFIDGHMHIESAMVTATEFARAALPHGTTTAFVDPHEIANVLGLRGVRFFLDESKGLPLKVLITFPSCVPAAPGFETTVHSSCKVPAWPPRCGRLAPGTPVCARRRCIDGRTRAGPGR